MIEQTRISKAILNFLSKKKWRVRIIEDIPAVHILYVGFNARWICSVCAYDERNQFAFYSDLPFDVPEEKRVFMSEFLTRSNLGQVIGNWEFDLDRGKIRFKTSIDVEGVELQDNLIYYVIITNVLTSDKYIPGIVSILEGNLTPIEAIKLVENTPTPDEGSSKKVDFEKSQSD